LRRQCHVGCDGVQEVPVGVLILPSHERVAFTGWIVWPVDGGAFLDLLVCDIAVSPIQIELHDVRALVLRPRGRQRQILHDGSGEIIRVSAQQPTVERVAFTGWIVRFGHGVAFLDGLAIDLASLATVECDRMFLGYWRVLRP